MIDESDFREAYKAFMNASYPNYPSAEELADWNSHLLTLDGHIAGYAMRIAEGRLNASKVPDVDALVLKVESLRRELDSLRDKSEESSWSGYRSYVSALEGLVREIALLAKPTK